MKKLGDAIRRLMEAKEITGVQLAADIGLTPTSVSRILNGASRPRQVTLSRLMKRLCNSREEEQSILKAYSTIFEEIPEESMLENDENSREEIARCERYLEIKTQSISFKNSVSRELSREGIEARRDYCEGLVSTDFLIEHKGKRIALECKFNVHRDIDKTLITAGIIRERLSCLRVFIVVPFLQDTDQDLINAPGITLVADQDLAHVCRQVFFSDSREIDKPLN
jgi:transcriptional regulator with XRE-family HTH domain